MSRTYQNLKTWTFIFDALRMEEKWKRKIWKCERKEESVFGQEGKEDEESESFGKW